MKILEGKESKKHNKNEAQKFVVWSGDRGLEKI